MSKLHHRSSLRARALWYVAPGSAELRMEHVPLMASEPSPEHVIVRTLWSTISRGTERLVFEGRVPGSEYVRMRCPFQEGTFPFPVKYGYSLVGTIEEGPPAYLGKTVFALHPHQTVFACPVNAVTVLPADVPPRRAVLGANMETALNAIWDSGASAGDRIAIVGAGAVGCLIASLAAGLPGTETVVCDIDPSREQSVHALGAQFVSPDRLADAGADVVFHTSASSEGLKVSLEAAGFEARIVEMSWYGDRNVSAALGSAFHAKRLKLVSSQVASVSERRRARWSFGRRLEKALSLLCDNRFDALIEEDVTFAELPEAMPRLLAANAPGIVTAIRYDRE